MNKKYKCAIIGYGYMGEIRHKVIDELEYAEISIICETDPIKINRVHDVKVVADYLEVLESDVDVVFV